MLNRLQFIKLSSEENTRLFHSRIPVPHHTHACKCNSPLGAFLFLLMSGLTDRDLGPGLTGRDPGQCLTGLSIPRAGSHRPRPRSGYHRPRPKAWPHWPKPRPVSHWPGLWTQMKLRLRMTPGAPCPRGGGGKTPHLQASRKSLPRSVGCKK